MKTLVFITTHPPYFLSNIDSQRRCSTATCLGNDKQLFQLQHYFKYVLGSIGTKIRDVE